MSISFPTGLDTLTNPLSTSNLNSPSHSGQHSDANDAIEALEAKVGIDSSAVVTSHDYILNTKDGGVVSVTGTQTLTNKTLTSPTINTATIASPTISSPTITGGSVSSTTDVIEVLKKVYPIGSIYTSITSTNPATLFGFGTWEAFGAGKTLIGLNGADADFDTAEETGGAKTATIAQANLPNISTGAGTAHTHTQNAHTHTQDSHVHSLRWKAFTGISAGTGWNLLRRRDAADSYDGDDSDAAGSTTATNQNATATNQNESSHTHSLGGSGTAMSIMNPYVVVYFFKRTA